MLTRINSGIPTKRFLDHQTLLDPGHMLFQEITAIKMSRTLRKTVVAKIANNQEVVQYPSQGPSQGPDHGHGLHHPTPIQ